MAFKHLRDFFRCGKDKAEVCMPATPGRSSNSNEYRLCARNGPGQIFGKRKPTGGN